MWCENRRKSGKKRKVDSLEEGDGKKVEDTAKSKRAANEEKIDAKTQELREKHGEQFTGPRLRLWARMHLNGQHDSLDKPPRIPLFTGTCGTKSSRHDSLTDALTNAATAVDRDCIT